MKAEYIEEAERDPRTEAEAKQAWWALRARLQERFMEETGAENVSTASSAFSQGINYALREMDEYWDGYYG